MNDELIKEIVISKALNEHIASYKSDIKHLNEMLDIYNKKVENLCGGFHVDMISEIRKQIDHCNECISNLQKH